MAGRHANIVGSVLRLDPNQKLSPKLRRNRTVSIDGEIATRTNRAYLESSLKHRAHQSDHGDPTSPPLQPPSSVQPTLVEAPEGRAQKGDLQTLGASFGGVLKWRDEAKSRSREVVRPRGRTKNSRPGHAIGWLVVFCYGMAKFGVVGDAADVAWAACSE
ncbi:sulfate adenylyltransferase subunit 2 [Striga asiatica]|uniref:Sulfate adenylyltransferase subunit 2 n=1 Tax=Striga asiatica TaxID=4170 RepID=A0A5A7QEV5_STRAF|nr:sulfate adenylyltransferase subunit 2 [Striga asiatica]